ncbi:hypothetical protein ABZ619_17540 [Streptomyces sp. NPDC007851]|uniref:hypothetical protein n=1 Tax=Streptomyces sp. NPDC007851 TaxID=3155008 RepID=UPI0033D11214
MTNRGVRRAAPAPAAAIALTGPAACTSAADPGPGTATAVQGPRSPAALRSAERSTHRARSVRVRSTTTLGFRTLLGRQGGSAGPAS